MMFGEVEVPRELPLTVTCGLGLQLDHPQALGPEHRVVRCSALFVVMPPWKVELVDELRPNIPGAGAERERVQLKQETGSAVRGSVGRIPPWIGPAEDQHGQQPLAIFFPAEPEPS